MERCDIAIVGAGMAGASLAAELAPYASVVLLEAEDAPGYHATGRSAAFWTESYGGPAVQPLTTASGPLLRARAEDGVDTRGYLSPRGALHLADDGSHAVLDALPRDFAGVRFEEVDPQGFVPGLRAGAWRALLEPSTEDIDVAGLHQACLRRARRHGAALRCASPLRAATWHEGGWRLTIGRGDRLWADVLVDAAGAWADGVARLAGVRPLGIAPLRRTIVPVEVAPSPSETLPLVLDAAGRFYFKREGLGRLWLSPHDETPADAGDAAPDALDVAVAVDRLERTVDWQVARVGRAWAGLRSFAPDRAPVYGFASDHPAFFWFAGQGGFGIQTAPAAALLGAALLRGVVLPEAVRDIDVGRYSPVRFDPD